MVLLPAALVVAVVYVTYFWIYDSGCSCAYRQGVIEQWVVQARTV